MKKMKLISVFIFAMMINMRAQNIALTNVSSQITQAQNRLGNNDLNINFQQVIVDNVNWDNRQVVIDNSNKTNEQQAINKSSFSFPTNNENFGIKKLTVPQRNKIASFSASHRKKKSHHIKHLLFKTSRKMDHFFAKQVKKKPVYVCAVW